MSYKIENQKVTEINSPLDLDDQTWFVIVDSENYTSKDVCYMDYPKFLIFSGSEVHIYSADTDKAFLEKLSVRQLEPSEKVSFWNN